MGTVTAVGVPVISHPNPLATTLSPAGKVGFALQLVAKPPVLPRMIGVMGVLTIVMLSLASARIGGSGTLRTNRTL